MLFLKDMIDDWNSQVVCPCEFSDFRDYSSWTNANEFTRIAFNLEKFYEDFTWEELVQTISCVCDPKSNESEKILLFCCLKRIFMEIHLILYSGPMNGFRIQIC